MTAFLAIHAASLFAVPVRAAVVIFDNSEATFVWLAQGFDREGGGLNPTVSPTAQTVGNTDRQLFYGAFLGGGSTTVASDSIGALPQSSIQVAADPRVFVVDGPRPGQQTFFDRVAQVYGVGSTVGPSGMAQTFGTAVSTGYFSAAGGRFNFLGQHAFIGFQVILDDGLPHYGWIELDYRVGPLASSPFDSTVMMYQPVRWAYETSPNTPITVPAPAGGAITLLAAAGLACRRRRGPEAPHRA